VDKTASENADNASISPPPAPPDAAVIQKNYEQINPEKQVRLDSIIGIWYVTGQTYDGRIFSGSVNFGENNELSATVNLNGFVQPVRYGSYSYSPSDGVLTIHFIGNPPTTYTITSMTENSFETKADIEYASYVRT
jgi:hypothetical protein